MHRTSALKSILHFWRSFGSRRRRAEAGRGGVSDGGDGAPAATAAAGASDRSDFWCCLGPAGRGCRGGASGRGHECLRWCNAGGGHDGGILEGGRATTASRFQAWWQLTVFCWHWGRVGGAAARTRLRLTSSPSAHSTVDALGASCELWPPTLNTRWATLRPLSCHGRAGKARRTRDPALSFYHSARTTRAFG